MGFKLNDSDSNIKIRMLYKFVWFAWIDFLLSRSWIWVFHRLIKVMIRLGKSQLYGHTQCIGFIPSFNTVFSIWNNYSLDLRIFYTHLFYSYSKHKNKKSTKTKTNLIESQSNFDSETESYFKHEMKIPRTKHFHSNKMKHFLF